MSLGEKLEKWWSPKFGWLVENKRANNWSRVSGFSTRQLQKKFFLGAGRFARQKNVVCRVWEWSLKKPSVFLTQFVEETRYELALPILWFHETSMAAGTKLKIIRKSNCKHFNFSLRFSIVIVLCLSYFHFPFRLIVAEHFFRALPPYRLWPFI